MFKQMQAKSSGLQGSGLVFLTHSVAQAVMFRKSSKKVSEAASFLQKDFKAYLGLLHHSGAGGPRRREQAK